MNSAQPKVSVIVTTYNQEDTLAATLESILAQDLSLIQITEPTSPY